MCFESVYRKAAGWHTGRAERVDELGLCGAARAAERLRVVDADGARHEHLVVETAPAAQTHRCGPRRRRSLVLRAAVAQHRSSMQRNRDY